MRYLTRDGRIAIRRLHAPNNWKSDFYHTLISMPWPQLLVGLGLAFASLAFCFALLYRAGGDCIQGARPGSLKDCFFFSVQTLATIGYGGMTPKGDYANTLVCVEAFIGLMSLALMTGLLFSKFSLPNSRVLFSQVLVRGHRNGQPAYMFRVVNERGNQLVAAHFTLSLVRDERTAEGEEIRRIYPLSLLVADTPVFALSFLATHLADPSSPLHNRTLAELQADNSEFIVTMSGIDSTLGATLHARYSYTPEELRWDHRFQDTIRTMPDGVRVMDYSRFHETERLASGDGPE